jgi:hypothetical protein
VPGPTAAATAPNQPVPRTSEAASRLGTSSAGGGSGAATRVRSASGMRAGGLGADGAHQDAVHAGALVARPAELAGVVQGPERADHELPRLDRADLGADLLDDPDVLVPHRGGTLQLLHAPVRPQVRAADAGGRQADDRIGRIGDLRVVAVLDAHVARGVQDRSTHDRFLVPSSLAAYGRVPVRGPRYSLAGACPALPGTLPGRVRRRRSGRKAAGESLQDGRTGQPRVAASMTNR